MRTRYPPTPIPRGARGRFVKENETFEFKKSSDRGDALEKDETIEIEMPTAVDVLVYKSRAYGDWVSHVIIKAVDVELKRPGNFGSEWRWPGKPDREQILEHVMDMLKHEMQHQLGLEAHNPETDGG